MYNNKKTGTSMGGTIISTRDKRHFAIQSKNELKKTKKDSVRSIDVTAT